jgi:predicted nuclease of restriction endonuclease-like RecB superfamily
MLTADLVPVRRKNGELCLTPIAGKSRRQHVDLAEQVMQVVADAVGMTREQVLAEIAAIAHSAHDAKIVKGYAKLLEDALVFEQDRGLGAAKLRQAVFEHAAAAWKSLADADVFDRQRVLAVVSTEFELPKDGLEEELFLDLPAAQRVLSTVTWSPEELVERYDHGRVAAVLLRATSVRATFRVQSAHEVRQLFSVLKFRRLLFSLTEESDGKYRLDIDGPYSLFDAVTKYGLQLALCWPALSSQAELSVEAALRWGKTNEKLTFRIESATKSVPRSATGDSAGIAEPPVSDEIAELREGLSRALPEMTVELSDTMLELPGVGLCVPDLRCKTPSGDTVYVEVMGFWSRDAVFRRVELVESGLSAPVLFVASNRLRVSEELLDDKAAGALYVYRGRINAVTAASKIKALVDRCAPAPRKPRARRLK